MSSHENDLCVAVLEDHFGYYVSSVGKLLLTSRLSLPMIAKSMRPAITLNEVGFLIRYI